MNLELFKRLTNNKTVTHVITAEDGWIEYGCTIATHGDIRTSEYISLLEEKVLELEKEKR